VCYIKPTIKNHSQKSQFKYRTPYVGLVLTLQIKFLKHNFALGLQTTKLLGVTTQIL